MLCSLTSAGSFASTLPTYQRSEVILFIMSKVPIPSLHHPVETGRTGLVLNPLPSFSQLRLHGSWGGGVPYCHPAECTRLSLAHRENRNRLTQIMLLKSLLQVSAPAPIPALPLWGTAPFREPRQGSNVSYIMPECIRPLKGYGWG